MTMVMPSKLEALPFWKAAYDGELVLQCCSSCGKHQFFPRNMCKFCKADTIEWKASKGIGNLITKTTIYRAPSEEFTAPYTLGMVLLEEEVMILGKFDANTEIEIGDAIQLSFEIKDERLPIFIIQSAK